MNLLFRYLAYTMAVDKFISYPQKKKLLINIVASFVYLYIKHLGVYLN